MSVSRYTFDPEALKSFLRDLFDYENKDKLFIEIRYLGERVHIKYLKYSDIDSFVKKFTTTKFLDILDKFELHFGVLPRENFGENDFNKKGYPKVAGRKEHVVRGRWLWADWDFKHEIDSVPEECIDDINERGICVLEDNPETGRLHIIVKDNNKIIEIERPEYADVIERAKILEESFGMPITYIIDSGYGYHLYTKLTREIPAEELEKLERIYSRVLGNDPKAGNTARIMRLPYTLNLKYKHLNLIRTARIVFRNDKAIDPEKAKEVLDKLQKAHEEYQRQEQEEQERLTPDKLKEEMAKDMKYLLQKMSETEEATKPVCRERKHLDDRTIRKIVELLKSVWIDGHRHWITHYFTGMMWWKCVDKESVLKIIDAVAKETNDPEYSKRIYEVNHQWDDRIKRIPKIAGRNKLIEEITKALMRLKPNVDEEKKEKECRLKAIEIVEKIEEYVKSPTKSILLRAPLGSGVWFVNDPRFGIGIVKYIRRRDDTVETRYDYITMWYIKKVAVVRARSKYYYKILFKNARSGEKIVLDGTLSQIIKNMDFHGMQKSKLLYDAVSSIISEFIHRKITKVRHTSEACGVYIINDKPRLIRNGIISVVLLPKEANLEKAKEAVETLKEIRKFYDNYKFDIVMQWMAYAVISYALKEKYRIKQFYLFLHGETGTGKSTLARMIKGTFPVISPSGEEPPEEGLSPYRLSCALNLTTFPYLIDEAQGISGRDDLLALIKRSATGIISRWQGNTGLMFHARSALMFTSNFKEIFNDSALINRLILLEFNFSEKADKKPREERTKFMELYNKYLSVAPHLGKVIVDTIIEIWDKIKEEYVHRIHEKEDALELGRFIWENIAKKLGVEIPWTRRLQLEQENVEEREREILFELIEEAVREAILRARLPPSEYMDKYLSEILIDLYKRMLLPPWLHVLVRSNHVAITKTIIDVIRKKYGFTPTGEFTQFAQRLGYRIAPRKIRGNKSARVMLIPLSEFAYTFGGDEVEIVEHEPNEEGNTSEDSTGITIEPAYLESLAHDMDNILFERNMEINKENIYNILLELGLPPGEDTEKIAEKVYEKLKEKD